VINVPTFRNLDQLRKGVKQDLNRAIRLSRRDSKKAMDKAIEEYYDYAEPIVYERTYKLASTPMVIDYGENGFKAFLNDEYRYPHITYTLDYGTSTSKDPTMLDVLNLTNYDMRNSSVGYLHPTVGKHGYWERAVEEMEDIVDRQIRNHLPII
jgi:hypothetical protein